MLRLSQKLVFESCGLEGVLTAVGVTCLAPAVLLAMTMAVRRMELGVLVQFGVGDGVPVWADIVGVAWPPGAG